MLFLLLPFALAIALYIDRIFYGAKTLRAIDPAHKLSRSARFIHFIGNSFIH